ncbi:MAG: Gfo/Idh/MocA family protein [Chthoniobacteraceae bacterium]
MSPKTPIPIAIVGLGFGRWIIKDLCTPELSNYFKIVAVCDLDTELAEHMAREINVRTATLDELIADPDVPAIGLFTGPVSRANLLGKLIRAGKHVMTTKPFERDIEAARRILEEARSLSKVIYLNSPAPELAADMRQIAQWRERYTLGCPLAAYASTTARYNEEADGRWMDNPDQCPVAPIFRIGIYLINDLIEVFGEAEEVQVMTSRIFTKRPTPDHAQLGIKFCNGGLGNILASFCVDDGDSYRNRLVLHFENGSVYRNIGPRQSTARCEMALVIKQDGAAREIERVEIANMSGSYPWEAFYKALTSPSPSLFTDPEKVCAGLRVINAMHRAEAEGRGLIEE